MKFRGVTFVTALQPLSELLATVIDKAAICMQTWLLGSGTGLYACLTVVLSTTATPSSHQKPPITTCQPLGKYMFLSRDWWLRVGSPISR